MNILTKIHQERGREFYERVQPRPRVCLSDVFPFLNLEDQGHSVTRGTVENDVVEIAGETQTGKSVTLVRSIVRLVLPKTVGGLEADVIFINVDHHIKKCHFVTCGEMELEKYRNLSSSNKKIILAKSLARLWIIDIFSADAYSASSVKIERLMSINRNISVIAVDSFSSLLQLFRASQTGQPIYQEKFFEREISNLTSRFPNVLLLYSKQDHTFNNAEQGGNVDVQALPRSSITLSIQLSFDKANSAIKYCWQLSDSKVPHYALSAFDGPFSLSFKSLPKKLS